MTKLEHLIRQDETVPTENRGANDLTQLRLSSYMRFRLVQVTVD